MDEILIKLEKGNIINIELSKKMQAMAGFKNIAVHDYSTVNIEVVANIVKNNLQDLVDFSETIIKNH